LLKNVKIEIHNYGEHLYYSNQLSWKFANYLNFHYFKIIYRKFIQKTVTKTKKIEYMEIITFTELKNR